MVIELESPSHLCPECEGFLLKLREMGETVCNQCGLVIQEREIDNSHYGKRAFNHEERSRKWHNGAPITNLLPDISLSTVIERCKIYNEDLRRAVKWDLHMDWKCKNLLIAITELRRLAGNLNLSECIQRDVINLYKEAYKKGLLRGRSIKGILLACVYLTCKKAQIPITMQDLVEESSVNAKILQKCYKVVIRELNIKPSLINPILLIPKYTNRLKLSIDIEKQTVDLVSNYMKERSLSGKDPKGLCAGALYLTCRLKKRPITQKAISEVTGITQVTLRSRYKELMRFLNFKHPGLVI